MTLFPLTAAVRAADLAAVVRALREGGSPDDERDDDVGFTPLAWAARDGQLPVAAALLACGADPLAKDNDGATPLDYARRLRHAELTRLLEQVGGPKPAAPTAKRSRSTRPGPKAQAAKPRKGEVAFGGVIRDRGGRSELEIPTELQSQLKGGHVILRLASGEAVPRSRIVRRGAKLHVLLHPSSLAALGLDDGSKVEVRASQR